MHPSDPRWGFLLSDGGTMDTEQLTKQMGMIERAIGGAFYNNGLHVHLLGGVQGPHTLTYALRLYEPTAQNLAKAGRLGTAVEAAIGDSPARIYNEAGIVWVEVPSPWPMVTPGVQLRGAGLTLPLGLTSRKTIAGIDFEETPHALIVGPTGRGKTTAARAMAFHLARQNPARSVRMIALTFKPGDWVAFRQLPHTIAVITDPQEAAQAIEWLRDRMHERAKAGTVRPHLFVFLDDLLNLLAVADVSGPLAEMASLGRAAGLHLIIGTQRLGKRGAGDATITGNIPARLVFGTADAQDASFFTGRGGSGAELLGRYKGDALLVTDGGTVRLAVSLVEDGDLATLPQDPTEARPWARTKTVTVSPQGGRSVARNALHPPTVTGYTSSAGSVTAQEAPEEEEGPLLEGKPTTPQDLALVRSVYAQLRSKTATCKRVWGGKNDKIWGWLHLAIESEGSK